LLLKKYFRLRFSDQESKILFFTKKLLFIVKEVPIAFWLQIVLIYAAIKTILTYVAYFFVTIFAILTVFLQRMYNQPDGEWEEHCNPESDRTLRISHLSDIHFMGPKAKLGLEGSNRNSKTQAFLAKNAIQLADVDLLAVTGDITDTGFRDEWIVADQALELIAKAARNNRVVPKFALVPGNHDINIFASFDKSITDLKKYDKKLALFGLGKYACREIRLIRYLSFWNKWSGPDSSILTKEKLLLSARERLSSISQKLSEFANSATQKNVSAEYVEKQFDSMYPARMELNNKAIVYMLDSNARTWHIVANSYGMFGLSQLYRLWIMLSKHPAGHAAIFLLHHHIAVGTKKKAYKNPTWRAKIEEFFMVTVDAFALRLVINRRLSQRALILHGHTHFERHYKFGDHSVICAPSSGYGEGSVSPAANVAWIYEYGIDQQGSLSSKKRISIS
jgi:hypothetical protein